MFPRLSAFIAAGLAVAWCATATMGQTPPPRTPATVTVLGSVVDDALTPVEGATVSLEAQGRQTATTTTDASGLFRFANVTPGSYRVRAVRAGFAQLVRNVRVAGTGTMRLPLVMTRAAGQTVQQASESPSRDRAGVVAPPPPAQVPSAAALPETSQRADGVSKNAGPVPADPWRPPYSQPLTERYAHVAANRFQLTRDEPLSTFGADVDTASYTNVRRFLSSGQLPPRDAVRVEEFVNYFHFAYPEPRGVHPLSLTTEIGDCPWAPAHKLVLIGARARASADRETVGRNIVLLVDVSGSMAPVARLPMLKTAFSMFADTLRPDDRLAIVTYAGSSGVALPPTPALRRDVIQSAIAGLGAGGSTNGGQGLILAYRLARASFVEGGVNRVILATDGDFNVGITSQDELLRVIERERESGVFLSVLGVGSGNLKDATMEMLADKGNGHYAYLDSLQEARRVLLQEGDATLETVAKDVKFQVEFNPAVVSAWKLIGYENRIMAPEHFNDDRKDGGEMGAGHTVTVLYEVVPAGVQHLDIDVDRPDIDPLRYRSAPRSTTSATTPVRRTDEWLNVKARYKTPDGETSRLITQPARMDGRIRHLPAAAAVAEFGLLLRDDRRDVGRWTALTRRLRALDAPTSSSSDWAGFVELVEIAAGLNR